ncbi:MAG: hypothetical protein ACI379_00445 [Nocardioides sp.]|uniref:hypothetical protein n=1 Tax=Nocardioides sp. TaxID=35761 RepID=UPI003F03C45D
MQVKLEGSRYPQLVTWSTAGEEQAVDVSGPGVAWASTRADFADHLVTPRGYDEKVTVSLPEGAEGVAVAVYEIDLTRPPAGVGDPGGIFFRDSSASHRQLGAAVAEPAATGITVPWNGAGDTVAVESVCTGAPEGTGVMVSLTGAEIPAGMSSADAAGEGYLETFGTCDDEEPGFDLGAAPTTSFDRTDPDQSLPASGTARMWLSVSEDDPTPLSEGEAGRAQFGLGVYTSTDADSTVLGFAQPLEIDRLGHRWTLHTVATMTPGEPLDVSPFTQDGPALVSFVQEIRKRGTVGFRIETTGARELDRAHMGISVAGEVQFGSELLLPGTTGLTLAFTEGGPDDVLAQRAVVYTLAD